MAPSIFDPKTLQTQTQTNLSELFQTVLNEAVFETREGVAEEIYKVIRKHFPRSYITVRPDPSTVGQPAVDIRFAFGKDKSEWNNGIIQNDRAHQQFTIYGFEADGSTKEKLDAKILTGGDLRFRGTQLVKFGWRKKSGNAKAIIAHFDKYFAKVKQIIADNVDRFQEG